MAHSEYHFREIDAGIVSALRPERDCAGDWQKTAVEVVHELIQEQPTGYESLSSDTEAASPHVGRPCESGTSNPNFAASNCVADPGFPDRRWSARSPG